MLDFLAETARQLRVEAGLMQVEVAAAAKKDQSVIYRFEAGYGWPRDTDLILAGYGEALGIDCRDIWGLAHKRWVETGQQPTVAGLRARRESEAT